MITRARLVGSLLFLLAAAAEAKAPFQRALDKYFAGQDDALTLEKLGRSN